jgi:hypothetical protein
MEDYLRVTAEQMRAERDARRLDEIEKDNLKLVYISEYQKAASEIQNRFMAEYNYCEEVFNLIEPLLQEMIDFAEQYCIFPPRLDETPEVPIQFFSKAIIPTIKSQLDIYSWATKDNIITAYQSSLNELMQEHVHGICGIKWGYLIDDSYSIYSVELIVSCMGEVTIGKTTFNTSELNSQEFKKALSDAFYSPIRNWKSYKKPNLADNTESEQEVSKPLIRRLILKTVTLFQMMKQSWITLWDEPPLEITHNTSFLKKLWYGFPTKDKTTDKNS